MKIVMSGEPFEIAGVGEAAVEAAPVEPTPEELAAAEAAAAEGAETPEGAEAPAPVTVLPNNITGQSASDVTCSAGRTKW